MSASNCPETPRQKMIQMMYLVYTAMLALNVSAEVVEGFKTVGNAMSKSNENMVLKLDDTFDNFKSALDNNPAKVKEKYDKAMEIKKLSEELVYTIDTMTYSFVGHLASKAEIQVIDPNNEEKTTKVVIPLKNEDGTTNFDSVARALKIGGFSWINKLDDNHAGTPYFIGNAEGKAEGEGQKGAAYDLINKIHAYKHAVMTSLGADSTHVNLGLDVDERRPNAEGNLTSWEQLNFNNTVAGAALVTLTRMKAEVMNAEFDAVNQLYKQVKSNDFSFDKVAVVARPNAAYILQGGKYELTVNVGAYDSKSKFEVNVGGQHFTSNDTGAVVYSTICNATGPKTINGTVYVKRDSGTEKYDFKQSYYVAEPMAVFELTEMNVVYSGIENPVKISVPGASAQSLVVTLADPSQATIAAKGAGQYVITPKVTKGTIKVNASIKDGNTTRFMGSTEFRVRAIPDPKIYLGNIEGGGSISIGDLKSKPGPAVRYGPDFAFKIKTPTILKQTVDITRVNGATDLENRGASWTAETKSYIEKAKPGCKITISVDVQMPDGRKRPLSSTFRITR